VEPRSTPFDEELTAPARQRQSARRGRGAPPPNPPPAC
jgi:hypothetical protein